MSDVVRIGLVAEGPTDAIVIRSAIQAILGHDRFTLQLLQPDDSDAFIGGFGPHGGGWKGVGRWCLQAVERNGPGGLCGDLLFGQHDLLIVHLDADVAGERPTPECGLTGLPCERPCPPASATTDALRDVLLQWLGLGETGLPEKTVFCIPSKSTEAWVMKAFFPTDCEMARRGQECHPKPEDRLGQQPKKKRFAKTRSEYREREPKLVTAWPLITQRLGEARRFQTDFEVALATL